MVGGANHQVINRDRYLEWSREQQLKPISLKPLRGKIVDQRGGLMAVSLESGSIFAHPAFIEDPKKIAHLLAPYLEMKPQDLYARLTKDLSFVWLARQIPLEKAQAVRRLQLSGIGMEKEGRRYYPNRELAAHLIGFVGLDFKGLEGLEWYYDKHLQGSQGRLLLQRDARGRLLWQVVEQASGRVAGCEMTLSLDMRIQYVVERELRKAVLEAEALSGSVVVLNPLTGELLAMASMPAYNPNNFQAYKADSWRNRSITDTFEPGSTVKAVLLAAALEEGIVDEESRFYCEKGRFKYGGHQIHDMTSHETLTVREILIASSNIGVTKIADKLAAPSLWNYLNRFGFGEKTGVDLPGEQAGVLRPWKKWAKVALATHAFGQGFSVTALKLASCFGVFANGGFVVEPYVVKEIRDERGRLVKKSSPKVIRRAVSKNTAERVRAVLEAVVQEGSGREAGLAGYRVAGKTGTAQKFDHERGEYSSSRLVVSFVGIVPADKPEMVIAVVINEPKGKATGGTLAAPVFRKIAASALYHRHVPESVPLLDEAADTVRLCDAKTMEGENRLPEIKVMSAGRPGQWKMPELRQLSLRTAFRILEGLPVKVRLEGSGRIIRQLPEAGQFIQAGQTLTLTASPDGGEQASATARQHG